MSDLIDRRAAIEALKPCAGVGNRALDRLRALPTVDAVEVVRCKDCKHRPVMVWSKVYDDFDVLAPEVDGKEDWRCPCLVEDDPYYSWSPNDNWFCASGERRESDGSD